MTSSVWSLVVTMAVFAGLAALVARRLFSACARRDERHSGSTPAMFHMADPYLAEVMESLYRP